MSKSHEIGHLTRPTSYVRRAKERSRVRSPQDSYPEDYPYGSSPEDLSVGPSVINRSSPQDLSGGPSKKGPGDLSVGPSIWKEVVRSPQSAGFIRRTIH